MWTPRTRWLRRAKALVSGLAQYADLDLEGNKVDRRTDFSQAARPVLLLPGFLATRRSLSILEHRLRRDGFSPFSLNLGGLLNTFNTHSIEERAAFVRDKIERLYERYPMGPLAIVGHSAGGLLGRFYIKRLGGHARVYALITLGSPHNGAYAAYLGAPFGPLFPSLREVRPMSGFIRRLKEGGFPKDVRLVSIYSKADKVASFPSTLLETNGEQNLLNVDVLNVPHHRFLSTKRIYEIVRREIHVAWASRVAAGAAPSVTLLRGGPKVTG